jgi:hypothetical protein
VSEQNRQDEVYRRERLRLRCEVAVDACITLVLWAVWLGSLVYGVWHLITR